MNKIISFTLIVLLSILLVGYTMYDNHHLDINFTGFYNNNSRISETYDVYANEVNDYGAMRVPIIPSDIYYLDETSVISTISIIQNMNYKFTYEIVDNQLYLIGIYRADDYYTISQVSYQGDQRCDNIMPIREFLARGRIINELEKLYDK